MKIEEELHFLRNELKEIKGVLVQIAHNQLQTVAAPTFSFNSTSNQLTITSATTGASIRYTTDGSEPTAESPLYSAPVSITSPATVRAFASKIDMHDSAVSEISIVAVEKPVVSMEEDKLTATCATDGATVKYGSTATEEGEPESWSDYSAAVDISGDAATTYWKFKAVKAGCIGSDTTVYEHVVE